MVKHIVMWKLKETAEGAGKLENARRMKSLLERLPSLVKKIQYLEVGINIIESPDSYDVALYSEFASRQDLSAYLQHPEHVKVGELIGKVRLERRVVDYET